MMQRVYSINFTISKSEKNYILSIGFIRQIIIHEIFVIVLEDGKKCRFLQTISFIKKCKVSSLPWQREYCAHPMQVLCHDNGSTAHIQCKFFAMTTGVLRTSNTSSLTWQREYCWHPTVPHRLRYNYTVEFEISNSLACFKRYWIAIFLKCKKNSKLCLRAQLSSR